MDASLITGVLCTYLWQLPALIPCARSGSCCQGRAAAAGPAGGEHGPGFKALLMFPGLFPSHVLLFGFLTALSFNEDSVAK